MKQIIKRLEKLMKIKRKEDKLKKEIEKQLSPFIDFYFFITYHELEGYCVSDYDGLNMPITNAIEFLFNNKKMTYKNFEKLAIY